MSNKRNALGKGLSALLEDINTDITSRTEFTSEAAVVAGNISNIPYDYIPGSSIRAGRRKYSKISWKCIRNY